MTVRYAIVAVVLLALAIGVTVVSEHRARTVVVVGRDGAPVQRARMLVRRAEDGDERTFDGPGVFVIPAAYVDAGYEAFVVAPGSGLLRRPLTDPNPLLPAYWTLELPPPIRITIGVAGDHPLPDGGSGIELSFAAEGAGALAAVLDAGPAPTEPETDFLRHAPVWVDPGTREAAVLLPSAGRWTVRWSHTDREATSFSIVLGTGTTSIDVAADGDVRTIEIPAGAIGESWD